MIDGTGGRMQHRTCSGGNMPRCDVLIFVEHVARELDIACAIKHLLEREHQLCVEIASYHYNLSRTLEHVRPSVVAVPYCYSREDAGMRQLWLRWSGLKIVNFAFEQLLSAGNKPFKSPRDVMAQREVVHLAAGDLFREYLLSKRVLQENVETVGSLSCGVYLPPYRQYFRADRTAIAQHHGLDADRPWIFFPENFGAAFFSERDIRLRIRRGMSRESLEEYCDWTRRALSELSKWCQRAAKQTEAEIILRPRPATPKATLAAAVESNLREQPAARFRVIKTGSVREWILASDHTVSNYSTALVEAAIAGKPASILLPSPLPSSMHCAWHEYTPQVTSCEQFVELVREPSKSCGSLERWAAEHLLKGHDPIAETAEILARIALNRRAAPVVTSPGMVRRLRERMRRFYRSRRSRQATEHRQRRTDFFEDDCFGKEHVEARTAAWRTVLC